MTTNLTALYGLGGTAGGCKWKSQTFTASGIWQKPEGVEMVRVLLVGGGGGGYSGSRVGSGNGGNSTFTSSTFTIVAKGGFAGGSPYGASGGGANQDYFFTSFGIQRYGHTDVGYYNLFTRLFGNGARILNSGSDFQWMPALSGISKGNSITGGGGGMYYVYEPYFIEEIVATPGGSVSGFGTGGSSAHLVGAGGGASFGDGVSALDSNSGGYGGGGAGYSSGGGGGEIVIREIPVSGPATIIIGAGGTGSAALPGDGGYGDPAPLPGKSGLCIVSWIE